MTTLDMHEPWPLRAWVMTVLGGVVGAACGLLLDQDPPVPLSAILTAMMLALSFVTLALSLERKRWLWAVAASLAIGMLLAFVGWNSAQYRSYGWTFDYAPAAIVVACLVFLPLFQTMRDEGSWSLPPKRVHMHVWADFVIGLVGVLFIGIVMLLLLLIDQLLQLSGLKWIDYLWQTDWFWTAVAGSAFGAVTARLRDRAELLGTLLTIKFTVLAVLAPVLAVAIAVFLGAMAFGGLATFWDATGSSTIILLACAVFAAWLLNSVIGSNLNTGTGARILRVAGAVLALSVLPLAAIGVAGLWIRVDALGWTPSRLWGVAAIVVALIWGTAYGWNVIRSRKLDDGAILASNVTLSIGVAAAALVLAMPFVDFGAVSTRSQITRLKSGQVSIENFDWRAMSVDFGIAGKAALRRMAKYGPSQQRRLASYWLDPAGPPPVYAKALRIVVRPESTPVPPALKAFVVDYGNCSKAGCELAMPAPDVAVLRFNTFGDAIETSVLKLQHGQWSAVTSATAYADNPDNKTTTVLTLDGRVEVRNVSRQQVYVNGQAQGDAFE